MELIHFLDTKESDFICVQKPSDQYNVGVRFDLKPQQSRTTSVSQDAPVKILKKERDKRKLSISTAFHLNHELSLFLMKIEDAIDLNAKPDISFTMIYGSENFLEELIFVLKVVWVPAIEAQQLDLSNVEEEEKLVFLDDIYDFIRKLETTSVCINEVVELSPCTLFEKTWEFEQLNNAAQSLESLGGFEECVSLWMRQIKKEIQYTELIYFEKEPDGPHSETRFWKQRMTRFNSLINQLRNKEIQASVTVLKLGNSKALPLWIELDKQVTHVYNEAKENSKFLQNIESTCVPLYRRDIPGMIKSIPNLFSILRLVYVYSTFYTTFANMTVLLSKISTQIIFSCRLYITNNNTTSIWAQEIDSVIDKMQNCRALKLCFQDCYRQTKLKMEEDKDDKVFDFSEIQIFGNLNQFVSRLEELTNILNAIKTYNSLHDVVLEGKEAAVTELISALKKITSKNYDFLDPNNTNFNTDYTEFQDSIDKIHNQILNTIQDLFQKCPSVYAGLILQKKFHKLIIPNLDHTERYRALFNTFRSEIEDIGLNYMDNRSDPPIERNLPYFAGRMYWSRFLYDRLEEPLLLFKKMAPEVFSSREGQKIIARYNRVCQTLIAFEIIHYRCWRKMIRHRVQGFRASLVVWSKSEPYPNMFVNLDHDILALFRELHCMEKAMCPIPYQVKYIKILIPTIVKSAQNLQHLVDNYTKMIKRILPEYEKLVSLNYYRLQLSLMNGFILYDWGSANIDNYIEENLNIISDWNCLFDRVTDLRTFNIEALFEKISKKMMICVPEYTEPRSSTFPLSTFSEMAIRQSKAATQEISQLTNQAYDAVQTMLDYFLSEFDVFIIHNDVINFGNDDMATKLSASQVMYDRSNNKHASNLARTKKMIQKITASANDLVKLFGQKAVEAVVKCVRTSMEDFLRHLMCKEAVNALKKNPTITVVHDHKVYPHPIFQVEIRIIGNKFVLKPSLEEMQVTVRHIIYVLQNHTKAIRKWSDAGRPNKYNVDPQQAQETSHITPPIAPILPNPIVTNNVNPQTASNKSTQSVKLRKSTENLESDKETFPKTESDSSGVKISPDERSSGMRSKSVVISKASNVFDKGDSEFRELEVNCFADVRADREIFRLNSFILAWTSSVKYVLFNQNGSLQEIPSIISLVENFIKLWNIEPNEELKEFTVNSPSLFEYQNRLGELDDDENCANELKDFYVIGPFELNLQNFKLSVNNRIIEFKMLYMNACLTTYVNKIEHIQFDMEDIERAFRRPLTTLDDISSAMETRKRLREKEINIDLQILAAEDAVAVLSRYHLPLPRDLLEKVEGSRSYFTKLLEKSKMVMNTILNIQGRYKQDLLFNTDQLIKDIKEFVTNYEKDGPMQPGITPRQALDKQIFFKNRFENLSRKAESYNKGEALFGLPLTDTTELYRIGKELDMLQKLYGLYDEVNKAVAHYLDIVWKNVDMEEITSQLKDFQNKCKRLPKGLKEWPAYTELQKTIDEFSAKTPLLEMMTNKAMKPRHWQRMTDLLDYKFETESDTFSLKMMMDAPLLKERDNVEDICVSAEREMDIESKMYSVINDWSAQDLVLVQFKIRGELLLKGDRVSELLSLLEDSLMVLNSLSTNRYNLPFRTIIAEWLHKLTTTAEVLDLWLRVQNLWVYLEAVFVGGDIAKQMPIEAKRFQSIDKTWIKIMERAKEISSVIQCCASDHSMLELLPRLLDQLELCQKSLSGYLEKKRLHFPRFFFVSDTVLLEILGKASDCHSIQPYLLSIFDNSKTAKFHEKHYEVIEGVYSAEQEYLSFNKYVKCEGHVEHWLISLMNEIHSSVLVVIRKAYFCIVDNDFDLIKFLKRCLAQIGILSLQLIWTHDASEALREAKYEPKIMLKTHRQFVQMLNTLINETTKDLTKYERTKFETLITIHVHQRDIFEDLYRNNIRFIGDFEWTKQTRVYFMEELDKCVLSITDVDFEYQNEFLGCTERLVITPLTDKCYITLAQALNMGLGGAPAGPAGTGKTETVKDMGRCLGKYVVVFNCSDQMDFRGLGRIFKGLAQSGSWGCFDEFNRIDLPVLSVAAQQIAIILQCKRENKNQFIFSDGDLVEMNAEFGIFLTMNPGYAGRQELPENLKINFRSVAMMVPDRQIIIRVKLAACGFVDNIVLARKFFVLYKLCEEQLTKQVHYDFGLRNILSVLRTLGAARRSTPNEAEERTVMRILRDMNLSKLVDTDEPLFISLINDLFPSLANMIDKASGYPKLEAAIASSVEALNLINHPPWVLKVIQLFETQMVRHGMMTLGPSGAGKTCCISVLLKSMTTVAAAAKSDAAHKVYRELRMNPKAITASQMFGKLDVATNDWTDGIFSTLWRRTTHLKPHEYCWLLLDGPVDAIWIENLNSVLDDNKTLTLANGDRIPMSPTCKIVFEVHNIDNASPATVSRNGMVYMSSSALNWEPIFKAWLNVQQLQFKDKLLSILTSCFSYLYKFITENLVLKMPILECFIINQVCHLLAGLTASGNSKMSDLFMLRLLTFSIMWSFGALLELDDRVKLDKEIREKFYTILNFPILNKDFTTFDYCVDGNGLWTPWENLVEDYEYSKTVEPEYSGLLIPNVDNVRTDFLIRTLSDLNVSVLLIGEPGTAKTVMVNRFAATHYNPEKHVIKTINFSSATTPLIFQRAVESFVEKRVGNTFGPSNGRKMTIFIDDINLPKINAWGDQVSNEIVRQTIEMKGFFNLEKPGDFTTVLDLQFIGAMCHPGGGRNDIPQRLKRHFRIFNCTLPANSSIDRIFSVIGLGHYCIERDFKLPVISMVTKLVPLTRKLWQTVKNKMKPTPSKFHYIFNLRDLSRIWQGMINTESEIIDSQQKLLKLWIHECSRVLCDRFIDESDITWFWRHIEICFEDIEMVQFKELLEEKAYFVDFLRDAPEYVGSDNEDASLNMPRIYEPIESFESFYERLLYFNKNYNESVRGGAINLVFFEDAMVHIVKISRVIRLQKGNILLVGVGGSGKKSLTRLAAYIADYSCFQIVVTRIYNMGNFLEDLKSIYRIAGKEGKGVVFLFTDNEIKDESYLEYINNMLASGMIPGLFSKEETDEILSYISYHYSKQNPKAPQSQEILYKFFLDRVRDNLHIVLSFSPVGEKFRQRALYFPSLISGCTINWFQKWPKEALVSVSRHYLADFPLICDDFVKEKVIEILAIIHEDVSKRCNSYFQQYRRSVQVTQKSYLSYISLYKKLYSNTKDQIMTLNERMQNGLLKLKEAQESIVELSIELEQKEKKLAVASKEAEAVLENVTKQTNSAEIVKEKVRTVKEKCEIIVEKINEDYLIAEDKLEAAKPALKEAEDALNTIKPNDITTVRKLQKPPHLIQRIMDCVLILFQKKIDSVKVDVDRNCMKTTWSESLKFLASTKFLDNLLNFSRDMINEETIDLLEPYFNMPDYHLEAARKSCGNVAGLCAWTKAMEKFYWVNREVIPLKDELKSQEIILSRAKEDLEAAESVLSEKEQILALVKAEYDEAMRNKKALEDDASACKKKMVTANQLMHGLKDEKERWTNQSREFEIQLGLLVGDVVVLSAFVSYCGSFNQFYRQTMSMSWENVLLRYSVPLSKNLDVIERLCNPNKIGEWNLQGLPNDKLSIENAIIVTNTSKYSLLIDPQSQGKHWLKTKESKNIKTTTLINKYFQQNLEDALTNGYPLLIEDTTEELDPALDNVLEKNFIKIGTGLKVKVGDKEVDVHKDFHLFITTKRSNPHFSPEIYAKVAAIDFSVTMKGLEDQLLGIVINIEKEELEKSRTELLHETSNNKRQVAELEDSLLARLASTQGSLVDDQDLLQVLTKAKQTSLAVSRQIAAAIDTEMAIEHARDEYRAVAKRGALLYFLTCVEFPVAVNHMYHSGLARFLELFTNSVKHSEPSPVLLRRINHIIDYLTVSVWRFTTRSLFKVDRITLSLLLALKIDLSKGYIRQDEFGILVKGGSALDLKTVPPKPVKWIADMTWLNLVSLSKLNVFTAMLENILSSEKQWRSWFDKECPEDEVIPCGYDSQLDHFKKMLLIRCWCPDRTLIVANRYIAQTLGDTFAEDVPLSVGNLVIESDIHTPLLGLLSLGADPTPLIELYARKHQIDLVCISMGQGQEVHARRALAKATAEGTWVLLQNCHLCLDYVDELFLVITERHATQETGSGHQSALGHTASNQAFRLWMTSEEHTSFPINMLQISIKFTNEPPQGIRASLQRSYADLTQDYVDSFVTIHWRIMYYALAFLHCTVQERRRFGPLGWNIPYEFNQADFYASNMFIQNHLDGITFKKAQKTSGIDWKCVRYMISEIQYGGRVTDELDLRLLMVLTRNYFQEVMFQLNFRLNDLQNMVLFNTVAEYRTHIATLPTIDHPGSFGLHSNADISYSTKTTKRILETILSIQPKDSQQTEGEAREATVYSQCSEMLEKIPQNHLKYKVQERLIKMGALQPMNIFLRQEIDRIDKVITRVRLTLTDLQLAIDGVVVMNDDLRDALDQIYDAKIPMIWVKISWESTTLGFWFTELIDRNQQFLRWLHEGRPSCFWLTGFFNPQGFLTAMRQEITRSHDGWALDNAVLSSRVTRLYTEDVKEFPKEGVYIFGLFLEGASWDKRNGRLIEAKPKILYDSMPIINLFAIQELNTKKKVEVNEKIYISPLYKKPRRTDLTYIASIDLPCSRINDHWIVRSVALLCDIK